MSSSKKEGERESCVLCICACKGHAASAGDVVRVESTYLSVPKHLDRLALHRRDAAPDEGGGRGTRLFFIYLF